MTSLIILNWKRPENVKKLINHYQSMDCIDEIIISNGNKETAITNDTNKVRIFNDYSEKYNDVFGLDRRFVCGLRAKYNTLIICDDDMQLAENDVKKILHIYHQNDKRIVGNKGRDLRNSYQPSDVWGEQTDIILTQFLVCQKKMCHLFFLCKPMVEEIYKSGTPYGNGEDIFFSFIVGIYFRTKHRSVNTNFKQLPEPHAISHLPNHRSYRDKLCRFLITNREIFEEFIHKLVL
jgi:hypothetical protein